MALALAILAWFALRGSSTEAEAPHPSDGRPHRRTTTVTNPVQAPSVPERAARETPTPETDSPERLKYRADLGAIADQAGLAVVECAIRDPITGGEVGRHIAFVDGVGRPDNGDARRTERQTIEDDLERTWEVWWDMPEGATHTTCSYEPARMFTLVLDVGQTGARDASCSGRIVPGPNEHPVLRTPCTLVGRFLPEGVRTKPIEVPQMVEGATYTAVLELDDSPEEPESANEDGEARVEKLLDLEDHIYDESTKWNALADGIRALRNRKPEGRIRELLDDDLRDYGGAADSWQVEEGEISERVDAALDEVDGPP